MQKRKLGSSNIEVSVVGLGCNNFGGRTDFAATQAVVHRALDLGVTLFDTADAYGNKGGSEEFLGRILGSRRKDMVLATKFGLPMKEPGTGGTSRRYTVQAVEASLKRLRTDWIDLYQVHFPDPKTPIEETLRALDDLVSAGKILYIGCSNYAAYRMMNSLWLSRQNRWAAWATLQAQYSLIVRDIEREHVPLCREEGLGILPWSPLANGFLTGKFERGKPPADGTRLGGKAERFARYDLERNWKILDAVRSVATEVDATPAAVSLAWLLAKPQVSSVIFGARTIEQLDANLAAVAVELAPKHVALLDQASALELGYPYAFINQTQGTW